MLPRTKRKSKPKNEKVQSKYSVEVNDQDSKTIHFKTSNEDHVGSKSVNEATLSKLFGVQDQSANADVILSKPNLGPSFQSDMLSHLNKNLEIEKKLIPYSQTSSQTSDSESDKITQPNRHVTNNLNQSFETDNTISKASIAPCTMTPSSRWCGKADSKSESASDDSEDAKDVDSEAWTRSDSSDPIVLRERILSNEDKVGKIKEKTKKGCFSRCLKKQTKVIHKAGNALGLLDEQLSISTDDSKTFSLSLGSLDPDVLRAETDSISLPSQSDDDMMKRGKPAVVLGYQTINGKQEPCVMLGMIANRDLESYEDLLDPSNPMAKQMNALVTENRKRLGIKSVRFNPNEEIIPSMTDSNDNVWLDQLAPSPRAGMFSKKPKPVKIEKPKRKPVDSDSPTYDELSDAISDNKAAKQSPNKSSVREEKKGETLPRETNSKQKAQVQPVKLKIGEVKMSEESSLEHFIPDKSKFGDVKRYNQDRFRNRLDHQPERPMEFKNPNDYYYDEAGQFSHYYYTDDRTQQTERTNKATMNTNQTKAERAKEENGGKTSETTARQKRRLEKLRDARIKSEKFEKFRKQERYDQLENAFEAVNGPKGLNRIKENDSDLILTEKSFNSNQPKMFGKTADGFVLRKRDQQFIEGYDEEYTENLSSDTTAETPNKNFKHPMPILEIGPTKKRLKDFGAPLELDERPDKAPVDDDEEFKEPGHIVMELAKFNHEFESISEYNQYQSVPESDIDSEPRGGPSHSSNRKVEFGFKHRARGKPLDINVLNQPVNIGADHDLYDKKLENELKQVIGKQKETLVAAITKTIGPQNMIDGLEEAVKVGETVAQVNLGEEVMMPRQRGSDHEYDETYDESAGLTQVGCNHRNKNFLFKPKPNMNPNTIIESKSDEKLDGVKPLIVTNNILKKKEGEMNRTVEQEFIIQENFASLIDDIDESLLYSKVNKSSARDSAAKSFPNALANRRNTCYAMLPGQNDRFRKMGETEQSEPYYSEPFQSTENSLAKDIAVEIRKKSENSKRNSDTSQDSSKSYQNIASDLIKSDIEETYSKHFDGTINKKQKKSIRENISIKFLDILLDEAIYQVVIESMIDVEADELLEELEEHHLREQNQNDMATKWRSEAITQLNSADQQNNNVDNNVVVDILSPAKGPKYSNTKLQAARRNQYNKENDLNEDFWNDSTPRESKGARRPLGEMNRIHKVVQDHTLKGEIKSAVDGISSYLPTPRAKVGVIWKSTQLPAKKVLLNEMFEDTKFLLEWIKSGVPNILITNEIKSLIFDISKSFDEIQLNIFEYLDSKDSASGEFVQVCKMLRRELNRSDEQIRTIEFIENSLMLVISCLDIAKTFIDSELMDNVETLLAALSFRIKAQQAESNGDNVGNELLHMDTLQDDGVDVDQNEIPNPSARLKNIENWSMSDDIEQIASIETDPSIISATTNETENEVELETAVKSQFRQKMKNIFSNIKYPNLSLTFPQSIPYSINLPAGCSLSNCWDILLSETAENIFLCAILFCFIAVIVSLLSPYYHIH